MMIEKARRKLHDFTFLLGWFRRRSAIRELAASSEPASAFVLAEAMSNSHPDTAKIIAVLRQLSPDKDVGKILALWDSWIKEPTRPLSAVLSSLGWPAWRKPHAGISRDIFSAATADAAPGVLDAVAAFARSQPLAEESINDAIYGAWVRSRSETLGWLIGEQGRRPGSAASVIALAEALGDGHPDAARMGDILRGLSPERDTAKVLALWEYWARTPSVPIAAILAQLGWPTGCAAPEKTSRDILALAISGATPEALKAVAAFARGQPVTDECINDAIYGAWVRSRSDELERLITVQKRQPGSPALEALHALVTGDQERYAALQDESGHYLIQAYALAPEPLRERLARAVAASPDRRLKAAYREALAGSGADSTGSVDNLKQVGDEDGLFEACRSLRLAQVLDLCERWAASPARPGGASQRAAVERAVAAYRRLEEFQAGNNGGVLPGGLVDIFDWWRASKPDDAQLRVDLETGDPFIRARGLYLGHERGIVDASQIAAAAASEHWPERLMARLVEPAYCAQTTGDHVFWATACGGDAGLLNAIVGGTPEEYARHCKLLAAMQGDEADARNRGLLEILCAFQAVFVGAGITVDAGAEASDRHAIEIEDAPDEIF